MCVFFFVLHIFINHLHLLGHRCTNTENDLEHVLTPSHAVVWSWEVRDSVRAQITNRHLAVGLGLPHHIGRVALVHSLVFLSQRVDLEIKQTSLQSSLWPSKATS